MDDDNELPMAVMVDGPVMECVADYCERVELIEQWVALRDHLFWRVFVAEC